MIHGKLFIDFDGVLVNFDKGCIKLIGHSLDNVKFQELPPSEKTRVFETKLDTVDFWAHLEPMPDFNTLWGYIKYFQPNALTAYPTWGRHSMDVAKKGKWQWAKQHLGMPEARFHCVARQNKKNYAVIGGHKNVLIDDHQRNIDEFNEAGGHGILHTSAVSTIVQLKMLGFVKS